MNRIKTMAELNIRIEIQVIAVIIAVVIVMMIVKHFKVEHIFSCTIIDTQTYKTK